MTEIIYHDLTTDLIDLYKQSAMTLRQLSDTGRCGENVSDNLCRKVTKMHNELNDVIKSTQLTLDTLYKKDVDTVKKHRPKVPLLQRRIVEAHALSKTLTMTSNVFLLISSDPTYEILSNQCSNFII